ncbi:TPA: hypothetical protein U7D43_000990 [Streptococcus agalactiae]|uniref:hypothetical protein n=1 Tax=Streptococcus agalactiae TaxID=1311 RepID=UPI0002BC1147|nr:hypothetical protein [Streptococcus agalactiae]QBX13547.1 hypothetical protein JavanS9_0011 [Streptococcus satellite phage Javan9]EPT92186.1 hypothetical protein SAG0104_07860 [Streptococcus agalactiae BSU178]EPU17689.1 hypothetical protein SAG0134_00890 [Streptococcus agalactiae LMG 14608]MCC9822961.1 hypothetical protein [Streptococcus agalactiae]MCC9844579.1 hypothetical protein [Streptococcus agalactiae]
MIQELNLTPTQTLILFIVLGLIGLLLSSSKPLIEIDLPEDIQSPKPRQNANYGAYIQSQNHYYN